MMLRRRKQNGVRSEPSLFLDRTPPEWNPVFATRREGLRDAVENEPFIESRDVEDGVVRCFMKSYDESDACLPRAEKVEQYCFGATLEALEAEKGEISEPTVAWLDERSSAGGKERARHYRGPLTARRLYQELKKPRFHVHGFTRTSSDFSQLYTQSNSIGPNQDEPEPDAERRKIFITDLDRWSIYALIGTASEYQALGLRDAIYKHLAFENFIGVTFPPAGLAMFQLAFHIPFYAWRMSDKAREDHRLDANASRLRQSRDVSFLNWERSWSSDFLYEAQISCLVTGSDESRWVAYCFVDTYFDAADEAKETVEAYHEDSVMDGGMHVDPLTFGVIAAEKAISTPREYFLCVFQIRIAQVKREWEQVVAKVRQSIREYLQTHSYSLCISRERSSSTAAKEHNEMIRKSRDWIVLVKRLTTQLLQHLSETVNACEKFCLNHAVYFQNLSEPSNGDRSLPAIQITFDELESLKKTLESLAESCSEFAQDLELHLILESVEVGNLQHKIAEDNRGLALVMMLFIFPIGLAAAILNMNRDIISFIPANFGSFVGLVLIFSVLGVLIYVVPQYESWFRQAVKTLAAQRRWQGMILRRKTYEDLEQPASSMIKPLNPSRHAPMAVPHPPKVDKHAQQVEQAERERPGTHEKELDRYYEDNARPKLDEDPSDDYLELSGLEKANYPNVDTATDVLVGVASLQQEKSDLQNSSLLDASPAKLQELVLARDTAAITKILTENFNDVARLNFHSLHALLNTGLSFEAMAELLIDVESASPWIFLDHQISVESVPSIWFHQENCVHFGGYELETAPRMINPSAIKSNKAGHPIDGSTVRETISKLCGIAGALPLSSDTLDWTSCVRFTGENSIAWISYAKENSPATTNICDPVLRMLDALQRAYYAVGYLQKNGVCCDTFTVLRIQQPSKEEPYVELCQIDVSLIRRLSVALEAWKEDTTAENLRCCASMARNIISFICNKDSKPIPLESASVLNDCALAVQILTVGILSYVQAHAGSLHPGFLVDPLLELHLLGNSLQSEPVAHVTVSLLELACMGDMLQKPVLVFRGSSSQSFDSGKGICYDVFASAEDIADTWSPARFIAEKNSQAGSPKLYAVEIGGGIIAPVDTNIKKLHWSAGSRPYESFVSTFDSTRKILIGGFTINNGCPLDETESRQHPVTNGYLRHLGTSQDGWGLHQKQFGLQGGQWAVLAFNATYCKLDGVTLKQQQLMRPPHEIDLPFLNSICGLQISICTGVARRVALRELLADVMVDFVESRLSKPLLWEELKTTHSIVQNFRNRNVDQWFNRLSTEHQDTTVRIIRSMLEVLKDTGVDKNGEELVVAWIRKESPYSCLRLRCEKANLWTRILADSEDCATFACVTSLCLEMRKHKCRGLKVAPWHNVSNLLHTAVCLQLSNKGEPGTVANIDVGLELQHEVSYWIGKSGSNLMAKVWLTKDNPEPLLVVRQKVIPEIYRARLSRYITNLGRLREEQVSTELALQVVILAEI